MRRWVLLVAGSLVLMGSIGCRGQREETAKKATVTIQNLSGKYSIIFRLTNESCYHIVDPGNTRTIEGVPALEHCFLIATTHVDDPITYQRIRNNTAGWVPCRDLEIDRSRSVSFYFDSRRTVVCTGDWIHDWECPVPEILVLAEDRDGAGLRSTSDEADGAGGIRDIAFRVAR